MLDPVNTPRRLISGCPRTMGKLTGVKPPLRKNRVSESRQNRREKS